jgi:hypothetical protein
VNSGLAEIAERLETVEELSGFTDLRRITCDYRK